MDLIPAGGEAQIILDRTPFYAESGGQVSDHGTLTKAGAKADVRDVSKAPGGQHVAHVIVTEGTLRIGDVVEAAVHRAEREDTIRNHTATHLLHRALKDVLGEHVNQAGSLVEPERLRFDFSHFGAVTGQELAEVERIVNEQIWRSTALTIAQKSLAEAKAMGAMALFGEKYGDVVRVVQVGDYSLELCGGCHVANTAQIGLFKIVSEGGIGSGIRRIEAVTGRHAYGYLDAQIQVLKDGAALLKTGIHELPRRIEGLLGQLRELSRENESLQAKLSRIEAAALTDQAQSIGGVQAIIAEVQAPSMDALRAMADSMKEKLGSGVVLLGAVSEGKVNLIAAVTADLIPQGYHAGNLIKQVAAVCGGGGGGRPDMAQAGGKQPDKLQEALGVGRRLLGDRKA